MNRLRTFLDRAVFWICLALFLAMGVYGIAGSLTHGGGTYDTNPGESSHPD